MNRDPLIRLVLGIAVMGLLAVTGCSSSAGSTAKTSGHSASSTTTSSTTSSTTSAPASTAAGGGSLSQQLATAFAGTDRPLPASGPAAVKGKSVWVLSCSSAAPGCAGPAAAVMAAGTSIGWTMKLVDGKFDPNVMGSQVRAAVAAHAAGLITVAVDCPTIAAPLQAAKQANMKVLSVYGFDCDNSYTKKAPLFSAQLNFGPYKDYQGLLHDGVGPAIAAYVDQATSGKGKILEFREDDTLAPRTINDGFDAAIKKCAGCSVDTVTFTGQDLVSGSTLQQKASAALSRYPGDTVVMAPYDASILLGIGAAVGQAEAGGRKLILTGVEGLGPNLALISKGVQAFAAGVPTEWAGWAAVDSLNRAFAGTPQVDEGIGIKAIDLKHAAGCRPFVNGACVDFKTSYRKIWGVS